MFPPLPQKIAGLIFRGYEAHHCPLVIPLIRPCFLGGTVALGYPLDSHDLWMKSSGMNHLFCVNIVSDIAPDLSISEHSVNNSGQIIATHTTWAPQMVV